MLLLDCMTYGYCTTALGILGLMIIFMRSSLETSFQVLILSIQVCICSQSTIVDHAMNVMLVCVKTFRFDN